MAGRLKHMERSHRSYKNKDRAFNDFHMKAYRLAVKKEQKKTMGQKLAGLLNPMKQTLRHAAER